MGLIKEYFRGDAPTYSLNLLHAAQEEAEKSWLAEIVVPEEKALGQVIAKQFGFDGDPIMEVFAAALREANYRALATAIEALWEAGVAKAEATIATAVQQQRDWMQQCGGDLAGYIDNYGSESDPDHYGNGGQAIFEADRAYLKRLEEEEVGRA